MAANKKVVKTFRRPVDEIDDLQTEVAMWLNVMDASGYLIQSMAQSTDVVTVYGASRPLDVDTAYITMTFLALRLPTS